MKTAILTDTNTGIMPEIWEQQGVFAIPMPVMINGKDYSEGISISHEMLHKEMLSGADVSTSMPSPGKLTAMWETILESGYDELLYIPMSSGLSGSAHAAAQLAKDYPHRVEVADNHRISVTLYESVLDAKAMADTGHTALAIKRRLEDHAGKSSIYIAVNTLEYLRKSGRVTKAGAAVAAVMNLKPVLTIQGGKLDAFAKMRGMKHAKKKIIDAVKNDLEIRFSNVPPSRIRIGAAGSFQKEEDAAAWARELKEANPHIAVNYIPLSCSITAHTGVDAVGVGISVVEKERIHEAGR